MAVWLAVLIGIVGFIIGVYLLYLFIVLIVSLTHYLDAKATYYLSKNARKQKIFEKELGKIHANKQSDKK